MALMAAPLVAALLPTEAGASNNVPRGNVTAPATSVVVTQTIVPTDPTTPRSTLTALSGTVEVFNSNGTYTVGTGICTAEVLVSGASGGNIQGTTAGRGSSVKGQFSVSAGDKYDITVGAYRGGGAGGLSDLNGGGASKIVKQSNAALIVEAGGGGGDSLVILTRTNPSLDTVPGSPTSVLAGTTIPPAIKVNAVPGRGADASAITAVSPVTATVTVPVGDNTPPSTSTSIVTKTATANAAGANTDSGEAILYQDQGAGTTVVLAKVGISVYKGGAGGGGNPNSGGADADAGVAGNNIFPTSTDPASTAPQVERENTWAAPFAVGAGVGGSGGINTIGNGFLKTAEGVNGDLNGKVTVRSIACSAGGSTLPPLGGGQGASGPLLPAALALVGAGIGMLVVRRRRPAPQA